MADQQGFRLIMMLIFAAIVSIVLRRERPKPPASVECLHCGSKDLPEIGRDPIGSRTVEMAPGGAMGGGDIRLQLDYEVAYRCAVCHKTTKVKVAKTF